jgi:hypothetical protein
MLLAQRDLLRPAPLAVQIAEPTVAVAAPVRLFVLLPDQLQGQVLVALEFSVDGGEIGRRMNAPAGRSGPLTEQQFLQLQSLVSSGNGQPSFAACASFRYL